MPEPIQVKIDRITLEGLLTVPEKAQGVVLFAHGSGSGRLSPRNNFVATVLNQAGLATLLIDLLSEEEDAVYKNRFDIGRLTERLITIIQWMKKEPRTEKLPLGLFGASTGAAAALYVAVRLGKEAKAVVSRGGRPDLALDVLPQVVSPTLLIVGGDDTDVIALNEQAYAALRSVKRLSIVPGATHLFEEPGCLEEVAKQSQAWFTQHLTSETRAAHS